MIPILGVILHGVIKWFRTDLIALKSANTYTTVTIDNRRQKINPLVMNIWDHSKTIFDLNKTLIRPKVNSWLNIHGDLWKLNRTVFVQGVYLVSPVNMEAFLCTLWAEMSLIFLSSLWVKLQAQYRSEKIAKSHFYRACFSLVYYKLCISFNFLAHPVRETHAYQPMYDFTVEKSDGDNNLFRVKWPTMNELHRGPVIGADPSCLHGIRQIIVTLVRHLCRLGHQVFVPFAFSKRNSFRRTDQNMAMYGTLVELKNLPPNIFLTEIMLHCNNDLVLGQCHFEYAS